MLAMSEYETLRARLAGVNLSALHRVIGAQVSLRTLQRIRNGRVQKVSIDTAAGIERGLREISGSERRAA